MAAKIELESTLTDRYQTTVPETVRRALKLRKRDKLRYIVTSTDEVILTRAPETDDDPVIGKFLTFLARDIEAQPKRLETLAPKLLARVRRLIKSVAVDLDSSLPSEDE